MTSVNRTPLEPHESQCRDRPRAARTNKLFAICAMHWQFIRRFAIRLDWRRAAKRSLVARRRGYLEQSVRLGASATALRESVASSPAPRALRLFHAHMAP
jgi:hypothetical protein